jgi:hypothetical protein
VFLCARFVIFVNLFERCDPGCRVAEQTEPVSNSSPVFVFPRSGG